MKKFSPRKFLGRAMICSHCLLIWLTQTTFGTKNRFFLIFCFASLWRAENRLLLEGFSFIRLAQAESLHFALLVVNLLMGVLKFFFCGMKWLSISLINFRKSHISCRNPQRKTSQAGKSFVNLKNYRGDFMLFGLIAIVLIVVSAVVFSILGVAVDNLGDKCIEMIDRKK